MPGSANNGSVRILTQGSARSRDIYQGCASGLYRQAFLTLGDTALAVGVVSDVIAESARWPGRGSAGEDDVGPGGFLSEQERGALGLVLIGGLGHVRASRVLGICPRDMAALLRTALLRLATSSAAVAETAEEQEKDDAETRIRHGDHHGSCRSRARGDGGQVAAGCAAVRGDEEDVTRAASRSLAASRPRAAVTVTMSGPRTVNGTPIRG